MCCAAPAGVITDVPALEAGLSYTGGRSWCCTCKLFACTFNATISPSLNSIFLDVVVASQLRTHFLHSHLPFMVKC